MHVSQRLIPTPITDVNAEVQKRVDPLGRKNDCLSDPLRPFIQPFSPADVVEVWSPASPKSVVVEPPSEVVVDVLGETPKSSITSSEVKPGGTTPVVDCFYEEVSVGYRAEESGGLIGFLLNLFQR
jgi:hypothetical protein